MVMLYLLLVLVMDNDNDGKITKFDNKGKFFFEYVILLSPSLCY